MEYGTFFADLMTVTLLATIGLFIGISPSLLAMTILAWGNSLGMKISECYVSPLDKVYLF